MLLTLAPTTPIFAQGYPVLDVANLMNNIQQLYEFYEQIQQSIETVQNTYQMIKQNAEMVASMDWGSLKEELSGNFEGLSASNWYEIIPDTQASAQTIVNKVNQQMNLINNLQDSLTNPTIQIGDEKFSPADLCGFGEKTLIDAGYEAYRSTREKVEKVVDGWAGRLTWEQRREIMRKYGMSAENYATLEYANYGTKETLNNIRAWGLGEGLKKTWEELYTNQAGIDILSGKMPDGSVVAASELQGARLAGLNKGVGTLIERITMGFKGVADNIHKNEEKEAIRLAERQKKIDEIKKNTSGGSGFPDKE